MTSSLRNQLSALVQRRRQVERRRSKRIAPAHRTFALLHREGDGKETTSLVHNLSLTGIAVHAECDYPLGTILHVLLVNASHIFSVAVDMKVVRCVRENHRSYLIAGPFERSLEYEEIVPFIL
jgi:hypothetical protein